MNQLSQAIERITRWGVVLAGVVLNLAMLISDIYTSGRKLHCALP